MFLSGKFKFTRTEQNVEILKICLRIRKQSWKELHAISWNQSNLKKFRFSRIGSYCKKSHEKWQTTQTRLLLHFFSIGNWRILKWNAFQELFISFLANAHLHCSKPSAFPPSICFLHQWNILETFEHCTFAGKDEVLNKALDSTLCSFLYHFHITESYIYVVSFFFVYFKVKKLCNIRKYLK